MAADIDLIGIADIGVVPAEAPGDPVVCSLDERAEIVGNPPAGEQAHLLHRKIVVRPEMRGGTSLLPGLGMGKGRLQHDGKGGPDPNGVSSRKAVWQVAHGWPVWRA